MIQFFLFISFLNGFAEFRDYNPGVSTREEWLSMDKQSLLIRFDRIIEEENSIIGLYRLDSLLLAHSLYPNSEAVEGKLLKVIRNDYNFIHSYYAKEYCRRGVGDLIKGNVEKGLRELEFGFQLDPSNGNIPLILAKYNILGWGKAYRNLHQYFSTFKYLDNKVNFVMGIVFLTIIFIAIMSTVILVSGLVKSLLYLSVLVREKWNIDGFWVIALLFFLFVWLPIAVFLVVLVGFSLVKMPKEYLRRLFILSLVLPFIIGSANQIQLNFSPDRGSYNLFKARYDPYNYTIKESDSPYSYAVSGIELTKEGEFYKAKSLFRKGYEDKESIIFLINLSQVYFKEGEMDSVLDICKRITSIDPDNAIANITMTNIYLDRLDFEEASKYIDRATESSKSLENKELPIYQYPPDNWLLGNIVSISGVIEHIKGSKSYILFILAAFFIVLSIGRSPTDERCPICNKVIIRGHNYEEENVCNRCYTELSQTGSKSIRERMKRHIRRKANRIIVFRNFGMNLILPGSAHFYKKRWLSGSILILLGSILLVVYLTPLFFIEEQIIYYKTTIGNSIFSCLVGIFYLLVLVLTWRLSKDGTGR